MSQAAAGSSTGTGSPSRRVRSSSRRSCTASVVFPVPGPPSTTSRRRRSPRNSSASASMSSLAAVIHIVRRVMFSGRSMIPSADVGRHCTGIGSGSSSARITASVFHCRATASARALLASAIRSAVTGPGSRVRRRHASRAAAGAMTASGIDTSWATFDATANPPADSRTIATTARQAAKPSSPAHQASSKPRCPRRFRCLTQEPVAARNRLVTGCPRRPRPVARGRARRGSAPPRSRKPWPNAGRSW